MSENLEQTIQNNSTGIQTVRNDLTSVQMIQDNLISVHERIKRACQRSGRQAEDVVLLAVSKTKPVSMIEAAMAAGQHSFGENYVQELVAKHEELPALDWHMIGHLQRNKVKYIVDKVSLIHSVDSVALAKEIQKQAAKHGVVCNILLEVNIAGEDTKWGFTRPDACTVARAIRELPNVRVRGLMTSAPYTEDPESNRIHFRNLRLLADEMAAAGLFDSVKLANAASLFGSEQLAGTAGPIVGAPYLLSMGMTGDFEVAIEEGANIVRVGTAIFGTREYH